MSTPLKVLVMSATPRGTTHLRIDHEVRGIREMLRRATQRDAVEVVAREAVRAADLQQILLQERPHVVHFSGHGLATEQILLEDETGQAKPVSKEALVTLFAILQDVLHRQIRAVVLNACHSAPQAEAISEHVDCTIGMSGAIPDNAAAAFSAAFYGALAEGIALDKAFQLGGNRIELEGLRGADVLSLRIRPEIQPPFRVLLHLDLATDNPISPKDLARFPQRPDHTMRLSELGVTPTRNGSDLDWPACAAAIRELRARARAAAPPGRTLHHYIAGRAALPVFALLGLELSAWADVTLLNEHRVHGWDMFPLKDQPPPAAQPFFTTVRGLDPPSDRDSEGRVAVFISTLHPLVPERIQAFVEAQGDRLAGIVALQAGGPTEALLDETRAPTAMAELATAFNGITTAYPRRTGIALFVAGPATLAFMAGRTVNPRVIRDIWLPNYDGHAYRPALTYGAPPP